MSLQEVSSSNRQKFDIHHPIESTRQLFDDLAVQKLVGEAFVELSDFTAELRLQTAFDRTHERSVGWRVLQVAQLIKQADADYKGIAYEALYHGKPFIYAPTESAPEWKNPSYYFSGRGRIEVTSKFDKKQNNKIPNAALFARAVSEYLARENPERFGNAPFFAKSLSKLDPEDTIWTMSVSKHVNLEISLHEARSDKPIRSHKRNFSIGLRVTDPDNKHRDRYELAKNETIIFDTDVDLRAVSFDKLFDLAHPNPDRVTTTFAEVPMTFLRHNPTVEQMKSIARIWEQNLDFDVRLHLDGVTLRQKYQYDLKEIKLQQYQESAEGPKLWKAIITPSQSYIDMRDRQREHQLTKAVSRTLKQKLSNATSEKPMQLRPYLGHMYTWNSNASLKGAVHGHPKPFGRLDTARELTKQFPFPPSVRRAIEKQKKLESPYTTYVTKQMVFHGKKVDMIFRIRPAISEGDALTHLVECWMEQPIQNTKVLYSRKSL